MLALAIPLLFAVLFGILAHRSQDGETSAALRRVHAIILPRVQSR